MSPPHSSPGPVSSAADPERWFAEKVHPHDLPLKSYLRASFPSIRDVDDVVQESYARVWRRQLQRPVASARSFLYRIARNLAIDTLRREAGSPIDRVVDLGELNVLDSEPDAADAACTSDELNLLLEAIEALPARCREILVLRKLRGVSQKEIALRLGITQRTVEEQGTRGLDRCEKFLRQRGVRPTAIR